MTHYATLQTLIHIYTFISIHTERDADHAEYTGYCSQLQLQCCWRMLICRWRDINACCSAEMERASWFCCCSIQTFTKYHRYRRQRHYTILPIDCTRRDSVTAAYIQTHTNKHNSNETLPHSRSEEELGCLRRDCFPLLKRKSNNYMRIATEILSS